MRQSKFNEPQRLAILAKQDAGQSVETICREHQISPATFYNWKKDAAIEAYDNKRELRRLERENARLKKLYAELQLDHDILKEGYEMIKKIQARRKEKR